MLTSHDPKPFESFWLNEEKCAYLTFFRRQEIQGGE